MQYSFRKLKIYLPQIFACLITSLVGACTSMVMVYSAVLIPQLKEDTISISDMDQMWIVNCISLVIPAASVCAGIITDKRGRLWVLKITVIPHIAGWATIALANTSTMILIGRVVCGLAIAFQFGPCFVYVSEISSPNIRGALLACIVVFQSGISVVMYLLGYFTSWRIIAWLICAYGGICIGVLFILPNSPSWLVSKNRTEEAKKSLEWLNKYQTEEKQSIQQVITEELGRIQEEENTNRNRRKNINLLQMILLPTVYKPFIVLSIVLFFQQFAGISVVLMNTVIFFDEIGITINLYLASTYFSIIRLVATLVYVWLMKRFGRRSLLILSFFSMSLGMGISGLYSKWIHDGVTENTWVLLCAFFIYFLGINGAMIVPVSLSSELFPLHVRGVASTVSLGLSFLFAFIFVSSYPFLINALNGIHNLQYMFASAALVGAVFTYLFVPETLNKRLSEIEEYFWIHTFAISIRKNSDKKMVEENE